jgi:cysteine desulfurase/selenocysteine lyase
MNLGRIREDFPILSRKVHGRRLVYLDNAATTQKPRQVIEALTRFYENSNANVHRGIHALSEEATALYEAVREKAARFLGAEDPRSIVFTRNTTESLNLIAYAWTRRLKEGDEILLSESEHHSNLVPWIMAAKERGLVLRHIPLRDDGMWDAAAGMKLFSNRTKVVSLAPMANALGTINPVRFFFDEARRRGALVVADGAQAVPHMPVNVGLWDCDFLAFSAHKMLGPMGVGVLYGKPERFEEMEPFLGGGEMIREVRLDSATWNDVPWKFEAGTPNAAGVAAFGAAIDYLAALGRESVFRHGQAIAQEAMEKLRQIHGIRVLGPESEVERCAAVSFVDDAIHPHDMSTLLDQHGVAVRAGHHCAQPLMRRLGVPATVRASFYVYNGSDDVEALVEAVRAAQKFFKP